MTTRRLALIVITTLLVLYPLTASGHGRYVATTAAILAMAAVGLGTVVVHVGLVSLGHAAFFGIGAYTTAVLTTELGLPVVVGIAAATAAGALYGLVMGPLALRSRGLFFVMITLAFAQLVYVVATQWVGVTGGDTGIAGIPQAPWAALDPMLGYGVTIVLLGGVLAISSRLMGSVLGRSVSAARQDEVKARALGYDVQRSRLVVFVYSAAVAGFAGALFAHHTSFVSPSEMTWVTSGELLVMVLIGGGQTLIGAALGAWALIHVEDWLAVRTELWELFVGLLFIAVVVAGLTRAESRVSRLLQGRRRQAVVAEHTAAAPPVSASAGATEPGSDT